jgi:cyclopropane fatty-acyl-phospholipid synthase-like methyltransferase
MAHPKPFADSCIQNREPILHILQQYVEGRESVLEIGSGTGQHAVYFAEAFPQLVWQTSDLAENHVGIQAWIDDSQSPNVLPPILLDCQGEWPDQQFDLLYTANTVHIMSQQAVESMFKSIVNCMHQASILLIYGPFNYQGQYTSESNARFDSWLKQRDPLSGIKNFEWVQDIAAKSGLECIQDHAMPANNRVLAWRLIDKSN